MKQTVIIAIIVAIIVGTGSLYAGIMIGKKQASPNANAGFARNVNGGNRQMNGQFGGMARMQGEGFVSGKIIAKDDQSITIESQGGGSKILFFSTSTPITKSATGSPADLSIGTNVTANGKTNSDGSMSAEMIQMSAEMIQIRPESTGFGTRPQGTSTQNR